MTDKQVRRKQVSILIAEYGAANVIEREDGAVLVRGADVADLLDDREAHLESGLDPVRDVAAVVATAVSRARVVWS